MRGGERCRIVGTPVPGDSRESEIPSQAPGRLELDQRPVPVLAPPPTGSFVDPRQAESPVVVELRCLGGPRLPRRLGPSVTVLGVVELWVVFHPYVVGSPLHRGLLPQL